MRTPRVHQQRGAGKSRQRHLPLDVPAVVYVALPVEGLELLAGLVASLAVLLLGVVPLEPKLFAVEPPLNPP
ncbi:MAG: hypothetical protein ACR2IK_09265 [Chloroflexota bacterium]